MTLDNIAKMKRELPVLLANQAQNHFVDAFRTQGWEGEAWKEPKRRIPGTPEYKYPKNKDLGRRTRATLVKTGALRRATGMSIRVVSFVKTELVVALPYAKYLNEGTAHIPKREFIGQSKKLTGMQIDKINEYFKKVWQA